MLRFEPTSLPTLPCRGRSVSVAAICCALALGLGVIPIQLVLAASIPAWLDDAITDWNQNNPSTRIDFVDIKDEFVWYVVPDTPDVDHSDIRSSIYRLVQEKGYKPTDEEERVTTGKPPTPTSRHQAKKCWTRSFVLDIHEMSNTTAAGSTGSSRDTGLRQRMLTSLVCQDAAEWYAGFRILQ